MNSIKIIGVNKALQAGAWCRKQFGANWELDMNPSFSNDPTYTFKFKSSTDASFFALRWA